MSKIIKSIKEGTLLKKISLIILKRTFIGRIISDKLYLKLMYYLTLGKKLNLKNPVTYNEKLQWLKLYDRNPEYINLVDKFKVREFVKDKIGEEYLIPLLGVWDNFDEIDFKKLPNQFVLKCNHDSGGIVICKDKSKLNIEESKHKINKSLKNNYYYSGREWPYKNVERKIIAEKYMEDESGYELKDYKFFCFNGNPKYMFVATDRNVDTRFDFYDIEFNHLEIKNGHDNSEKKINKPKSFDQMKKLATILSKNIPHVRVDFYEINGKVYFGEMTFYHWSGFVKFEPNEWDYEFGKLIDLHLI